MSMPAVTINLRLDGADQVQRDLALLSERAERAPEIRQRLIDLIETGVQALRVDRDGDAAAAAGEVRVRLQLSDPFAELVERLS